MKKILYCLALALARTLLAADSRPNIIVILADDMGIGDLSCYGGHQVPTPNIDRLASEGTRFTQYYSASPICSPSRAGLITGMYPARWSITSFLQTKSGNAGCEMADYLDPRAPALPRALKAAGYATAHIGKWHLGGGRDVTDAPKFAAYGYDHGIGTYESPEPCPDITATDWIWSNKDKVKRWNRTAFFVDQTLDFLDKHRDRPCFVNLWPDDVHTPWVPDEVSDKKDLPKNFHPVLGEMDRQIGRFLKELKARGLEENTIVIFASDNGPLPTFEGARAGGYRGSKLELWEGGIRMPFIVRWPGHVPAGRVDERSLLSAVDLFPTLCAFAGAAVPQGAKLDGLDVSGAWLGTPVEKRGPLFWEYGRNDKFFHFGPDRSPSLAVRRDNWKLLVNPDGSKPELYDLATDPAETRNLASANPALTKELVGLVEDWRASWPSYPRKTYRNPLMPKQSMADPDVLKVDGKYYLYGTTHGRGYEAFVSEDLVHWENKGSVFEAAHGGAWAPDLFRNGADGKFFLYYTDDAEGGASDARPKRIGVAEADGPLGPFRDKGALASNAIDAHLFQDDDGLLYLYYVDTSDASMGSVIRVQPMSDPVSKTGESQLAIRPTEKWEKANGPITEGPFMLKRDGTYYLMYSGTFADSPNYAIGYATSRSPLGPFVKFAGNPVVRRGGKVFGPGHHCVIEGPDGQLWLVYHQKWDDRKNFRRFLALDRLWFDSDGVIHASATRDSDQAAP